MSFLKELDTQPSPQRDKAFQQRAEQTGKERKFMDGTSRHDVQLQTEATKTRRLVEGRWVVED